MQEEEAVGELWLGTRRRRARECVEQEGTMGKQANCPGG